MSDPILKVNPADNIIVALDDLKAGQVFAVNGSRIELQEDIPLKHKYSETSLDIGDSVYMYGVLIGHAISDDLIHWRDLPYSIYPGPERACFSGTVYIEEGERAIAMYHGTEVGTMVATSSDPLLLNWEKVTGGPVIPYPKPGDPPVCDRTSVSRTW